MRIELIYQAYEARDITKRLLGIWLNYTTLIVHCKGLEPLVGWILIPLRLPISPTMQVCRTGVEPVKSVV